MSDPLDEGILAHIDREDELGGWRREVARLRADLARTRADCAQLEQRNLELGEALRKIAAQAVVAAQ